MMKEKFHQALVRFKSTKFISQEEEQQKAKSNFLKPLVETLILSRLCQGDSYGYEIAQSVKKESGGRFKLPEGAMYPTLYRLMDKGDITDYESEGDGRQLRVYYQITPAGRDRLQFLLKAYAEIHEGYQTYLAAAGGHSAGNGVGGNSLPHNGPGSAIHAARAALLLIYIQFPSPDGRNTAASAPPAGQCIPQAPCGKPKAVPGSAPRERPRVRCGRSYNRR